MDTKLVIDVFSHSLAFIMLLCSFKAILIVLDAYLNRRCPVFDGCHTLEPYMLVSVFRNSVHRDLVMQQCFATAIRRAWILHDEFIFGDATSETMRAASRRRLRFWRAGGIFFVLGAIFVENFKQ